MSGISFQSPSYRASQSDLTIAITASGAMSPQNGPENEKQAVAALINGYKIVCSKEYQ